MEIDDPFGIEPVGSGRGAEADGNWLAGTQIEAAKAREGIRLGEAVDTRPHPPKVTTIESGFHGAPAEQTEDLPGCRYATLGVEEVSEHPGMLCRQANAR